MRATNGLARLTAVALGCATPVYAIAAGDTTAVPKDPVVDRPAEVPRRVPAPGEVANGVVRIYRDSVPWCGENRDVASFVSLGKAEGSNLFIHQLSDLALGIPAGTAVVLISSNGCGDPSASTTQNSRAAQKSLQAFVVHGGVLIVDMGDNDESGGYIAPRANGTPEFVLPEPCGDATFAQAAKGPDGVLGTADDHPVVKGPDRASGTADDLDDSNIDLASSCYIAHGNLEQGIALPGNTTVLMTATFEGIERAILAEYRWGQGLIIVDTVTKEFFGQTPEGFEASLFMRSLFAHALQYTKKPGA